MRSRALSFFFAVLELFWQMQGVRAGSSIPPFSFNQTTVGQGLATPYTPDGSARVASEDSAPTYSASTSLFTPAATPNDIASLSQNNNGPAAVYLKRVTVSCLSSAGGATGVLTVRLQKTVNGGFGTATAVTADRHDLSDPTPNGLVQYYTTNRTGGNANGISASRLLIAEGDMTCGVAGSSIGTPIVFDYSGMRAKSPLLKDPANLNPYFVINLNSQTLPTNAQLRVTFDWQEERLANVAFIGDSTTALATAGLLNNGVNGLTTGGLGWTGLIQGSSSVINFGSNGFRLFDFLNNVNGVTYPISNVLGSGGNPQTGSVNNYPVDIAVFCYGINDLRQGLLGSSATAAQNLLESMIDTFVYAAFNGATSGGSYTSPVATSYTITNATWTSSTVTITTSTNHQFNASQLTYFNAPSITVAGVSPSGYNGAYVLTGVPAANQLQYALASNPGAYVSGGTETFATSWYATFTGNPNMQIVLWAPNAFTADDAGSGSPNYYLDYPQTSGGSLIGTNGGLTLAQAAQQVSGLLDGAYTAYAAYLSGAPALGLGKASQIQVAHKQAVLGSISNPYASSPFMMNQLHPGPLGQLTEARQITPYIVTAIQAMNAWRY